MPASKTHAARRAKTGTRTACHRPAIRTRRFRHDNPTAVDLFSGFGGLTESARLAGFETITAANHNAYKVEVHEANHPYAEHWIANLVDKESSDYHSAADLPYADLLCAGISCTNHSGANTQKAYEQGWTLFDIAGDEEYEERVTRSERDRATALCVLQYADKHHPRVMLIECTTEFTSWGPALPGRKKVGDGSTYRWWRQQLRNMGYRGRVLYLNSMFFGVPQSRDRIYMVFWDESLPEPDLEHRPEAYCQGCDKIVQAVWTWKTGVPPTGVVRYGQQYNYRCPSCRREVVPPMAPAINALDLTDLGKRIGDKPLKRHRDGSVGPMASATMARAARCVQRMPEFPPVLMPAGVLPQPHPWRQAGDGPVVSTGAAMVAAGNTYERPGSDCRSRDLAQPLWTQHTTNGVGVVTPPVAVAGGTFAAHRHNGDGKPLVLPMDTITTTHERAVLFAAVDNYQGVPRGVHDSLPTQGGSETMALVSAGVLPFRRNTVPTTHAEPISTVTAEQVPGLITAAGFVKNNGAIGEAGYRAHPLSSPLGTVVASGGGQSLMTTGWQQAGAGELLLEAWREAVRTVRLEDCYFRMLRDYEVGTACDFDVSRPGHQGTFKVWGTAKQQIDGYGNAVSASVGKWIAGRLRRALMAN